MFTIGMTGKYWVNDRILTIVVPIDLVNPKQKTQCPTLDDENFVVLVYFLLLVDLSEVKGHPFHFLYYRTTDTLVVSDVVNTVL